ncbi:MAG: NADH-quinone oxidoreductase subunit NuoE [Chloroflexota bacterium]
MSVQATADPIDDLLARYTGQQGALIPLLQQVQGRYGYLKACHIEKIARFLKMSPSELFGVLTFYAQFRLTPPGRTHVRVCQGTACHVRGGKRILQELETALDVRAGSTSEDFEYSLERIACFGACSLAPVVVVGSEVHGRMTPQKVKKLFHQAETRAERIEQLEAGELGVE